MSQQQVDMERIHLLVGRIVVSNYLQTEDLLATLNNMKAELDSLKAKPEGVGG